MILKKLSFLILSLLFLPLISNVFGQQDCTESTSVNGSVITCPNPVQTPNVNNVIPISIDGIMSKINSYFQKIIGSSNISPNSNPIGISSDKMKVLESTWYDTAKQLFGVTKSINNSTTTTINELSPVKLSSTVLWILGIVITGYIVFIFVKKFWKHVAYLIILMIMVIIFFITLGVHNIVNT